MDTAGTAAEADATSSGAHMTGGTAKAWKKARTTRGEAATSPIRVTTNIATPTMDTDATRATASITGGRTGRDSRPATRRRTTGTRGEATAEISAAVIRPATRTTRRI